MHYKQEKIVLGRLGYCGVHPYLFLKLQFMRIKMYIHLITQLFSADRVSCRLVCAPYFMAYKYSRHSAAIILD